MNPTPAVNTLRPSACPGLLRIVQALDGGICRIKLAGGSITSEQAHAVADAAQAYAGGVIEATNRANLQVRGIGAEEGALIAKLLAAGLGPSNAAGDDVRNLMLSPSAGIDPQMLFDTHSYLYNFLPARRTSPPTSPSGSAGSLAAPTEDELADSDNGYFAVFDGHAGTYAADWCGKKLHLILEETIRKYPNTPVPSCSTLPTTRRPVLFFSLPSDACSARLSTLYMASQYCLFYRDE